MSGHLPFSGIALGYHRPSSQHIYPLQWSYRTWHPSNIVPNHAFVVKSRSQQSQSHPRCAPAWLSTSLCIKCCCPAASWKASCSVPPPVSRSSMMPGGCVSRVHHARRVCQPLTIRQLLSIVRRYDRHSKFREVVFPAVSTRRSLWAKSVNSSCYRGHAIKKYLVASHRSEHDAAACVDLHPSTFPELHDC